MQGNTPIHAFRLDPEDGALLEAVARALGTSKTGAIRRLVREYAIDHRIIPAPVDRQRAKRRQKT